MKKLFFVKKNVNEPTGTDNWIEMNVDEFKKFIETEAGRNRRNNFAPLLGFGTGDADYYIETTREEVSKIRKDNNRHAYLKKLEMESGFVTVSLNELDLFGENEQEDRIVDMTAFSVFWCIMLLCQIKEKRFFGGQFNVSRLHLTPKVTPTYSLQNS